MSGVCDACKKHTGEKHKKSQGVMEHCSSPLEPACPPQADSEGRGSTHVRFSRGGGVFYRIAGGKPHLKKSKPVVFPKVSAIWRSRYLFFADIILFD